MLGSASLHILANNYQPLKWALCISSGVLHIKVLSFIRNYYIYLYYWFSVKNGDNDRAKPIYSIGFATIAFAIFPSQLIALLVVVQYFDNESIDVFYNYLRQGTVVESRKGTVNGGLWILFTCISVMLTYLTCCFNVTNEHISSRLNAHKFFSNFSWWKLCFPLFISTITIILLL